MVCKTIKAASLPTNTLNTFVVVHEFERLTSKGYNAECDCYYWGYRPEVTQLLGLGGAAYSKGDYRLCVDVARNCPAVPPQKCPTCPKCEVGKPCPACPKCEPQKACKECPSCPECQQIACKECPDCPECQQMAPPGGALAPVGAGGAYGPALGFLLAALVVGGGGFMAYKYMGKKKR